MRHWGQAPMAHLKFFLNIVCKFNCIYIICNRGATHIATRPEHIDSPAFRPSHNEKSSTLGLLGAPQDKNNIYTVKFTNYIKKYELALSQL